MHQLIVTMHLPKPQPRLQQPATEVKHTITNMQPLQLKPCVSQFFDSFLHVPDMRLHLIVLVFALWALTYTRGGRSSRDRPPQSSGLSINERVKMIPVDGYRFRRASRNMVK